MSALEEMLERLRNAPPEQRARLLATAQKARDKTPWRPLPGPQSAAYYTEADITLYGGAAGPGKTDLLLGLAMTKHQSSLIMRRRYADLSAITDRAIAINRTRRGFKGSSPPRLVTHDGRIIDFGAMLRDGDEQHFKGRPHDFLGFDEVVEALEKQFRFLITWNRSTDPTQRLRVVAATNPPLTAAGIWVIAYWAAWLDPRHPNPAEPGELRWYVTHNDRDIEVESSEATVIDGETLWPMSRTFIPGRIEQNPYLTRNEGYMKRLDSLVEPYKSAFRDGNFMLGQTDQERQLIPVQWVLDAQLRWTPQPPQGVPMCTVSADMAGAGTDPMVIAHRHDGWFGELVRIEDVAIKDSGSKAAGEILSVRRDRATIVIDMGGGYGGKCWEHLTSQDPPLEPVAYKGSEGTMARTADRQLGFANVRSAAYWKFREALDPDQPSGSPIALPDDPVLRSDLTAPTFEITPRGIEVEPKEKVSKRLGRSTDDGDATVMCWYVGMTAASVEGGWANYKGAGSIKRGQRSVVHGHVAQRKFIRR